MTVSAATAMVYNDYPTTDARYMPETEWHGDLIHELKLLLAQYYYTQTDVCVCGDVLLFYEFGNRRKHISPDVFVAKGAGQRIRPNYLLWEEGVAPQFVIEVLSPSTTKNDLGRKLELYRDLLKVREYFTFGNLADNQPLTLQGFRRRGSVYQTIRPRVPGRLTSLVTGLELVVEGNRLRFFDPRQQAFLLTDQEQNALSRERANEAEARAAAETERANAEAQLRLIAQRRADREARERAIAVQRAEAAEAELARLRAQLAQQSGSATTHPPEGAQ